MNIKRNIIFALESRKKDGVPITQNVPIRMRVIYASQRIEFTTGYRIDIEKWDTNKQRVRNGCTNKLKQVHLKSMPNYCGNTPKYKMYSKSLRYKM